MRFYRLIDNLYRVLSCTAARPVEQDDDDEAANPGVEDDAVSSCLLFPMPLSYEDGSLRRGCWLVGRFGVCVWGLNIFDISSTSRIVVVAAGTVLCSARYLLETLDVRWMRNMTTREMQKKRWCSCRE